uniref:rRNA N-glycosidase n=1 Tax=Leersia perrieri TaxID=77586 RepID=A0A0D9XXU0_9ORYZ
MARSPAHSSMPATSNGDGEATPPPRAPRPTPTRPLPDNTTTLSLNGSQQEFMENFKRCQMHLWYWNLMNSQFHIRYGNQLVYTTPLDGTFYYVLEYEGRHVVLVILARMAWLIGFGTTNGFFQMQFEGLVGPYMDSSHCHMLRFKGNHGKISPNGTGDTIINLHVIRKCFVGLCTYVPSRRQDPEDLPLWNGTLVVFIMESKACEIYRRHCRAIVEMVTPELGTDFVTKFIVNWSAISTQVMKYLTNLTYEPHDCNIPVLVTLEDLMNVFYYLHVDGWYDGLFEHDGLPPGPKEM